MPPFKANLPAYALLFSVPVVFYLLFLHDPLIPPKTVYQTAEISVLYAAPLLIAVPMSKLLLKQNLKLATIIACMMTFFSTAIYIDAVQLTAGYSTGYNYGEVGLAQTAVYLMQNAPGTIIIAPWDVAFASGNAFYQSTEDLNSPDCVRILGSWNVSNVVLRGDWDGKYKPMFFSCLKQNYNETIFGNFFIYNISQTAQGRET